MREDSAMHRSLPQAADAAPEPLRRRPRAAAPSFPRLALAPAVVPAVALALVLAVAACEPSAEKVAADRGEIEEMLERYAEQLSQAYAFTDPEALAEVAMPREVASVETNIARLAQDGRRIASHQKQMTIEDLDVFQVGDAYVRTHEVWDIRVMALGAEEEISRDENQASRVRYRLKKDDEGRWKVLWRQRLGDEGGGAGGIGAGGADAADDGGGE